MNFLNFLNFLINGFWLFVEIKNSYIYIYTSQALIDSIAFISNMKNVMMGNYYIMENIQKDQNLITKQNENFKVLINNYILKEYYVFKNVSFIRPMQENEMISLIKNLLLIFESLLIGFQKFVYEYVNYFKHLFNWYNNFKILIDKSIINSNIKEELYYNISLELLSEAQNEHNRALWWTLQNVKNLNKNILIQLVKNYFKVFNENPYRVSIQLMHLYKNYSKINILSYGLNYDINILTHNKHVLSKLNTDILSSKTIFFNSNKVIKGIDKEQHFILNNTSIWKSKFRKKNIYFFKVNQVFSDYMTKFINDRWVASGTFANKTYTLTRLKLLNNTFFNFDFLNDSILVRPWSNYNLKARVYYPTHIVFKPADLSSENLYEQYVFDKIRWNFFWWHQPDITVRFLQSIARFFAGTKEHIDPSKISNNVLGGSNEILNLKDVSKTNLSEDAINLLKLRKLYGGYTYWWAWHQDATFLYKEPEEKGSFVFERTPYKEAHYVMGYKPIYFKLAVISDMKIDVGRFFDNQPKYMLGELSKAMMDYRTTVSEVNSRVQEIDDLLDPNSGYSKKYAEYKNRNKAPAKKKIYVDEGAAKFDDIMYDSDIDKMIYDKKHGTNTATMMGSKVAKKLPLGKMRSVTFKNAVSYDSEEYKKALEMERIRELKDPLHLYGHRYPKAYKLHYLTSIPEFSTEKKFKSSNKEVMSYMQWKIKKFDESMIKLLKGLKRKQKWHFRWKRYYGDIDRLINWKHWTKGEKTIRRKLVLHGNIGLTLTKKYFKTFLVANDIWADVSFLKKSDLLKKFKPYKKYSGKDYTKHFVKKVITVTPDVQKSFGKFFNLRKFAKYNNAYTKFVNLELKNHAANVVYWNILHKSDFLYKYILNGNIYDKRWLQEVKNVSWSYMIEKLPKEVKPFKTIKSFRFKHQDLIQMKIKYNTPIKYKKIPTSWHTRVVRSQAQVKVRYIVPRKWFEHFFYPELNTRVEAIKFRKSDVIFELNMSKTKFKKLRSEIKFDYNPKMKFDVYKNIIQRNFNKKWLRTKDMTQISFKGIRGFLMFMFNYDVFANTEYLSTMDYLRKNTVTWGSFYHINIESITEPLNLNFIQKTFYGKHVNKGFNSFLYKKVDLVTNTTLPKTRNILLKKAYIRNLIYVYEKEDKPMINYILYIIKREEIKIIHKFIINILYILWDNIYACFKALVESYKFLGEFFLKLIKQELLKFREARRLKNYFEQHPEYITYMIMLGLFFIYTIICIFLILIIKTFLPKNLIYGKIFIKDIKNNVDLYHNKNNNAEDIKLKYNKNFIETISELEDIMDIRFDKKSIHNEIKDEMLNSEVNDITIDNLKKLELYVKLKKSDKLRIKKNFFDPEHKYVYSWENKDFNLLEEIKKAKTLKKIIPLEDKRFLKKRIYTTKFEEKKVNDLKKKYIVFYKAFIFEKNLEKWEDNTKRRLDFFFKKENKGIVRLLLTDLWRSFIDRRFNHNRMLFWDNPDLEDTSRITYMFAMYKPFFNIFFILKFILASLKLWDYNYWMTKWRQYVMFGVHANINYKEIRGRLEKDWSLEWFKDEADYGRIHFKDLVKVIKKYEEIKKLDPDSVAFEKKKVREKILSKILDLTSEKNKLKQVRTYLLDLKTIKSDRIANGFDAKFKDMATKLILDIDKIGPYKWAEQALRFKYRNEVYEQKLKIVKEEYETLKKSYTSRVKRDLDDKEWTLQTIHWRDDKKIKLIMKQKIAAVEHEKNVREYNYHNKFIDSALDAKDKIYYEAIKEYNHELSEEHLNIKKEEADEKLEETKYEKKSRKLFGILEQNYIYFRWFTTMGTRFNYIFVLIVGIFAGWWDNIKKIGKNEFTISTLFLVIKADLFKYVYKIYWEYLILWNKRKASQKLGFSIKEILKFAIILTPLFLYSTFLYSIFFIYFILFIILFILPKKIYINLKVKIEKIIKKVLIKKIINIFGIILDYFVYIWKIINFLFKDMDGNTLWTQLYTKFYKFCGWLEYNVYMIKGAFVLGYTNNNNNIKKGLISIFNLLKLKCTSYLEQRKIKKKHKVKYKSKKLWLFFTFKLHFIIALIPYQSYLAVAKKKLVYYYYHFLIKKILRLEKDEFIRIFKNNIALFKKYFMDIIEIIINTKNASVKDILILIVKTIWRLLILPIKFVINHQKIKYIKNYKQGIQGFRDNPMYLILDNPKRKNSWKLKLHKILMEQEISYYLKDLLDANNTMIDIFFIFKIHEVKWTNKNYYQDFFWRKSYWEYKKIKKFILNSLIDLAVKFEENYASFEQNIETRNWTLWERCKYAFYTYRLYIHGMSRKSQLRKSRDLFFYKKGKDKSKIMRSYFIKGVINWITYITFNKVIFTKIHNLKSKKTVYKYMKYKYKLKDIEAKIYANNNIHLTEQLKNTPPQLWSLIIMYEIYYKTLLRYRYEDENFPTKWVDGSDLQKKDYKWRLSAPEHIWDVPFYDRRFIAADINSLQFIDFVETLATEPYDPLLRWIIFLMEYGMATEDIIGLGEQVWLESDNDRAIWADISLTHLLTYNKKLDEYKYEIRDFNRLIKGVDVLRVAENTLQRDKLKHYEDRFKLVSNAILAENEDILKDLLKERRTIRAKMLHRALARNRLKTRYEVDQELAKEQEREFFFAKKREFFEELLIEEFWDWQAEYDEGAPEDKYFNSHDIFRKTEEAHIFEEYFLQNRKRLPYNYLLNNIVLKSFDQTIEEIHYFLTFKVWKILEKTLKKNKKIIEINYKHLNISNKFLSRLNYDAHITSKVKWVHNKKTKKDDPKYFYDYKYKKLEWEPSKQEALYGFMETNVLAEYSEAGEYYTYNTKIEYNEEALKYSRPPRFFHGQRLLIIWMKMISKRNKTLKNIKKKSIKKKRKLPLNIAYINNIKWTWEQWLIYTDVDTENELLNKNTVILNERFHLWNLKRVPIRVKVPVSLTVDIDEISEYIGKKSNYMSFMNHRHIMMLSDIAPMLKQGMIWEECKKMLEKRFNKDIQELVLWIFTAQAFNTEVNQIHHDYQFVLKNFIQNYGVFHKLYFVGMPQYTWDLIRYHEAWWGRDEFPYDKYYQLKQIEFLNHDPAAKKIVRRLYQLYLDKYSPISFTFFFKYQYFAGYWYKVYGILAIISFVWTIKVLMYNPGEFISENYLLFTPMLFTIAFCYLRWSVKKIKDIQQGEELYLYKYHESNAWTPMDLIYRKERMEKKKKEWTEHFYDADKLQELFPEGLQSISTDINPDWWRHYTHRNKNSEIYNHAHAIWWMWAFGAYFLAEYWKFYKFKYHNSKWLWDYYRYDEELVKELIAKGIVNKDIRAPQNYKEKQWFFDSWWRLENGGNWYSRWYENHFRKLWKLEKKELDYGFDWQKISNVDMPIRLDRKIYHFPGAVADVNWITLSRTVENYNKLPDEIKDLKKVIKLKQRKKGAGYLSKRERRSRRWQKKWAREKYNMIFDDVHTKKYDSDREITNLEILKDDIIYFKNEALELFKKVYYRDRYIAKFHPLAKWGEFLYWVQDNVGFDTTGNVYARFLLKAKIETKKLIRKDLIRHKFKKDDDVEKFLNKINIFNYDIFNHEIFNFVQIQKVKRAKDLILTKSKCFYKGESMDMRTLLSIPDSEMHVAQLRYVLLKHKQSRILRKIFKDQEYYINNKNKMKFKKRWIKERDWLIYQVDTMDSIADRQVVKDAPGLRIWSDLSKYLLNYNKKRTRIIHLHIRLRKMKEIDLNKKLYAENLKKLKRYSNYLKDIPKRIQITERHEYRYNVMINFLKKKEDVWIFLKDFFFDISLEEFGTFVIKIITKIFE